MDNKLIPTELGYLQWSGEKILDLQIESDRRLEILKTINADTLIKLCPICKIIWINVSDPRPHHDWCELFKELSNA